LDGSSCQVVDGYCAVHHGLKPETSGNVQNGGNEMMYDRKANERDAATMMDNIASTTNITNWNGSEVFSTNGVPRSGPDQQFHQPMNISQSHELPSTGNLEFFDQDSMQDFGWLDSIPFDFHFYSADQSGAPEFGGQRSPNGEQWNARSLWQ
jgi:hypothetical protein